MRDTLEELMGAASGRADYAEARHVATRAESLATRNGLVDEVEHSESEGVGVRVRVGGAWGFAGTRDVSRAGLEAALERALAIAASQPRVPATPLAPEPPARGRWESHADVDPFAYYDPTLAMVAARQAIPRDATYTIVVGRERNAMVPGLATSVYRIWLLPRRYTPDIHEAQWALTYWKSSEFLGVPYSTEIGLGPGVNAVKLGKG